MGALPLPHPSFSPTAQATGRRPPAPCRIPAGMRVHGEPRSEKPKEHRMKIKVWQVLLPIAGIILIKLSVVVGIVFVAVHFIRKFW